MRALFAHWEFVLAAGLFLACVYATVFFVITGRLEAAGHALFFVACSFFCVRAFALPDLVRRDERAEEGEG